LPKLNAIQKRRPENYISGLRLIKFYKSSGFVNKIKTLFQEQ